MLAKFLLVWVAVSAVFHVVVFVATRRDRRTVWRLGKRAAISIFGGALIVLPLFLLNNLSGG